MKKISRVHQLMSASQKKKVKNQIAKLKSHLVQSIEASLQLQKIYNEDSKSGGGGYANSFAYYEDKLQEILECDDGKAGLRPFMKQILNELK